MIEKMSDTPRTDKAEGCRGYDDSWIKIVGGGDTTADFARELERENIKLEQENIKLREALEKFRGQHDCFECTGTAEDCLDYL